MRTCARCKVSKPVDEFPLDPRRPSGRYSYCSPCKREYMRERRRADPGAATAKQAKQALAGLRTDHAEWMALAENLFGMPADDKALHHFLSEFIPAPEADVISPRVRANIDKARDVFRHLYLDSPTVSEAHRGTALGLVHASVEYLDHVRGFRNQDTYLGRTMLKPEPLKAKAVSIARRVCVPA